MGWSQTELDKKLYDRGLSPQRNTAFTNAFGGELDRYLDRYAAVAAKVREVGKIIPARLKDAYFAAIEYHRSCLRCQCPQTVVGTESQTVGFRLYTEGYVCRIILRFIMPVQRVSRPTRRSAL
jgi:acyl-CoA hydrolase